MTRSVKLGTIDVSLFSMVKEPKAKTGKSAALSLTSLHLLRQDASAIIDGKPYAGYVIYKDGSPWRAAYRCLWYDFVNDAQLKLGFDNLVVWSKPELPDKFMTEWLLIVRKANVKFD